MNDLTISDLPQKSIGKHKNLMDIIFFSYLLDYIFSYG